MKFLLPFLIMLSPPVWADFMAEHTGLCHSAEARKLMGKKGSCQLVLGGINTTQVSSTCTGKLLDTTCKVMMLKSSDSASMTLHCTDGDSPLVSQVLDASVMSYNISAVIKTSRDEFKTLNDPNEYHLFSNPSLDVQLSRGTSTKAKVILTIQDRAISLSDVVCE